MSVLQLLDAAFAEALAGLAPGTPPPSPLVKATADARNGDYQSNCAMQLQKALGKPPRDVAAAVVARLKLDDVVEPPQIAGPGFINLRLTASWLAKRLQAMAADERLGVAPVAKPQTFVIDYGSPNVAKPMHVGHLRSTIIGDAIDRLLRFLGHEVVSDNHIGDWGLQFGKVIYGYKHFLDRARYEADPVQELARLYKHVHGLIRKIKNAKGQEEEDPTDPILIACREETARLHAGDPENKALWDQFMPACLAELNRMYDRLGVSYDYEHGESFYNPLLPGVVEDLLAKGVAVVSQGAVVVMFGEEEAPAMVRKRDGAFTYTTSDLATIKYRVETFDADAILYVVDKRQEQHFRQFFEVWKRWGLGDVRLEHVKFGTVMGEDGRPFKTREGTTLSLEYLLDEGVEAALAAYERSSAQLREAGVEVPELSPAERRQVAEVVGLGAIKYADLSQNRESDYVFSWEKMLAMTGNTGTYMQYAYARNRSIFRRGGVDPAHFRTKPPLPTLDAPEERALALQLVRYPDALMAAAADYRPSQITTYLWDLAKAYSTFFEKCPVLRAETPQLRDSRLLLCDLTARVIQHGLGLLGIKTLERM
jgi:arginyl-tRNA synthetase